MFDKPVYERIFEAARPFLQTRQNELHTKICLRFALRLLQEEGGDADIVVPGVLLHDVGWSAVPESLQLTAFGPKMTNPGLRDVHEREGAALAREILENLLYPADKVDQIVEIVSRHDSRPDAESLEERIVKDADKLWRFSREGLTVDPDRFETSPAEHLSRLKGALDRWFLTGAGNRMARAELSARERELATEREGGRSDVVSRPQ
jgi:hypothetical protein